SELAPDVIRYDLKQKCYLLAGEKTYFTYDVDQALYSLAGERAIAIDTEHAKRLPNWVDTSIKRRVPVSLASTITRCIFQHQKITADYTSVSSGPRERPLSPLALIHDGLRWHIRCFDHEREEFRDYNLSRFRSVDASDKSNVTLDLDTEWNNEVNLRLVPHPKSAHPEAIYWDYDMRNNEKNITLKACLVGYFLRHWHIDFSNTGSGNPRAQQLYLDNKDELLVQGVPSWAFKE
ncbi:MAG TPA: WYL domain-containing transcriptional regulator, partial [Gammaproteobacteria bacterium]|nr:WYL domain-containing transcriptional regulator [Gammaproteobacteria bacterium]